MFATFDGHQIVPRMVNKTKKGKVASKHSKRSCIKGKKLHNVSCPFCRLRVDREIKYAG